MVKAPLYVKTRQLPEETVLIDQCKVQWILGPVIGEGGFGCIYSAKSDSSSIVFDKVIKIEPATNGPLFTEINFCRRVGKDDEIKSFMKEKKLDFIGMPRYISFGLFEDNRFLVMDRFGQDLHKTLMSQPLSSICMLQVSLNIIDVLEYIHSKNYAHADIKALNIMRGFKEPSEVYLLDFGMVSIYCDKGKHRDEKIDPKCKNNGTIEFCPRDSHAGLQPSRRGDMESLMYNLIFWLSWDDKNPNSFRKIGFGMLPWLPLIEGVKSEKIPIPVYNNVAECKINNMRDPKKFIQSVGLNAHSWSKYLIEMLIKVDSLKYAEKPDYDEMRTTIATMISEIDGKPVNVNANRKVNWKSPVTPKKRASRKRSSQETNEIKKEGAIKKKRITPAKGSNNSNCENVPESLSSRISSKKASSNIFKNFDDNTTKNSDFPNNIDSKKIIKRKTTQKVNKNIPQIVNRTSSVDFSSENSNDFVSDDCMEEEKFKSTKKDKIRKEKSVPETKKGYEIIPGLKQLRKMVAERSERVTRGSIIPGQKMLEELRRKNNEKEELLSRNAASVPSVSGIIPGHKTLKRFNKSAKQTPPNSPANSVSCQTSPSLLERKQSDSICDT